MTFRQIEEVVGTSLPPASGRHAAWWSNNPSNNVMTKVWIDAGYRSERVDLTARKLVFRRVRRSPPSDLPTVATHGQPKPRAPDIFERLRDRLGGSVTFAPGFDPTAPTGEVWNAEVT